MSRHPSVLSPTKLASHLACAHKTQLDRAVAAGLQIAFVPDARLDALLVRGARFEQEYVDELRRNGRDVVDLRGRDTAATLAAMQDGAEAIVQADLSGAGFAARADVLLRVDRASRLGGWSYVVVDTKLARETKAGTILQLLTYGDLLSLLQGVVPDVFFVRTPLRLEQHRTADFAAVHRRAFDRFVAAATSATQPATYPEPVPHCDVCGYWQYCARRRRDDDHLSLVAGLARAHAQELTRQGVSTLTQLAATRGRLPESPRRGREETFAKLAAQAELQRRALTEHPVPFEPLSTPPELGLGRLPPRSDGDLFLDFEGDPFVGDGGREYLTGWVDARGDYDHRWGLAPVGEKAAIENFLGVVGAARRAHAGMRIYHFAAYEPAALKRVTQRYDACVPLLDELLREGRFVDLRTVVREALRAGVAGYGLKDLEALIGFVRKTPLQIAAKARQRVEIALELGDDDAAAMAADQETVRAYNEEDCKSTRALRDWLWQLREAELAKGATFTEPKLGAPEPPKTTSDRGARIAALADGLRAHARIDADRAKCTDAQRPFGLLADLAGYFQREDKCQYWEHYRLRELPEEDWLDEREMVAELTFLREAPLPKGQSTPLHVYSFPPQETGIDDEVLYVPAVLDPDPAAKRATKIGDAVAIDHDRRELTIKKTERTVGLHPRVVFREQVIGTGVLEASLLAFVEHVRDLGSEDRSAWGPARDLLWRRVPRLRSGERGTLQREGESVADALVRVALDLEQSVLPVQGPPGTGKSHSGALGILALLRAGKTVGVTAVSHKVIDNLLGKVHERAAKTGQRVRLLHKHDGEEPPGIVYLEKDDAAEPGANTVLGGTAWLWSSAKRAAAPVDYLFVDEAGQMALATVLAASRGAKNLVLLGDPMQLEQPRRGAHPEGSDRAALVHLLDEGRQTLRDDQGLFLGVTWRMHPALTAFTSKLYYEDKLTSLRACAQQRLDGTDGFDGAGAWWCAVEHDGNQARSDEEVAAVVALCARLLRRGATWTDREGVTAPLTAKDVLVVAPYNAQVGALGRALAQSSLGVTRVGTVDRFQGQEAPVVIYSCTSSSAADAPRGMPFLYDPHRFNVATSRAKACTIVVGSPHLLEPECHTVDHLRMANGLCAFVAMAKPTTPVTIHTS